MTTYSPSTHASAAVFTLRNLWQRTDAFLIQDRISKELFAGQNQILKRESAHESPKTPPLTKEPHPQPVAYRNIRLNGRHYYEPGGLASTPKLSSISGVKTETSSVDAASARTSSEADRSEEVSVSVSAVSNASEVETEWVEQDEPGVYITIRAQPGGVRELRRVRFSRERFGEMHARLWWEENRARIHEQYL